MKSRFFMFFLMIAIVTVLVLGIFVFLSVWDSVRCPDSGRMKVIGSFGTENDPRFDPAFDANAGFGTNIGFVMNPYQTGNSERDTAVMIGASVSYILRELKNFTLFVVVLTALAFNAYALIVYFIFNKNAKQGSATPVSPETRPETVNSAVMGHVNGGKDPDGYNKRTSGMLSLEIDEMLAEIDAVMEKCKSNQRVLII